MFKRYAIFHTPIGAFADWGAAWLGWNSATGQPVAHPVTRDLDASTLTRRPRKYGLHATLKAPFRLCDDTNEASLRSAVDTFAAQHHAVEISALTLAYRNGFIALRPAEDTPALSRLATDVVQMFDPFRAALTQDEIAHRRKARLSPRQDQQMLDWGYPFVFDDFHFHITLTGRIAPKDSAPVLARLAPQLETVLNAPYAVDSISLMGEDADGMFHVLHSAPLLR